MRLFKIGSVNLVLPLRQRRQQAGVALLTALVIMAIAVSLAASLAYRQQVSIRLAGNLGALEQAYQYSTGMEAWAGIILSNDLKDSTIDALDEDWATLLPPIPIPGGYMNGQLFDLQARINLNDLLIINTRNGQKTQQPDPQHKLRLQNFFTKMKLPQKELVDNLLDWLDENNQENTNGAESGYYKTLEEPYLTANSSLVSASELLLIKGFNEKVKVTIVTEKGDEDGEKKDAGDDKQKEITISERIAPFISTLPANKIKINVNTALAEVLSSLGIDETQITNILKDREDKAYNTVDQFIREIGKAQDKNFPKDRLSVNSEYFLLQGIVEIGKVRVFINSTIHRDEKTGRTRVIHREFSQS